MSLTNKKDFKGIDFIKFIMAIFVVAIHTDPFERIHENIFTKSWDIIVRIAVPYFFIASGFLLFSKVKNEYDRISQLVIIKQYIVRIIKLYLYWSIIFLPITIWKFATNDLSIFKNFILFIRGIILIGENHYSWPLWYLLSMIYSLILIYILIYKNQKTYSIFIVSVFVFFVSILMDFIINSESSNDLILLLGKLIKITFENGRLFSGMLYIMIGAIFANQKIQFPQGIWILLIIIGSLFQIFQLPFISSFLFVLLPCVIFHISLNMNFEKIKHGYFFRKSSTVMYFTHMIVFVLYTLVFNEFSYFGWDPFLISILIPILLTPIIIRNENKYVLLKKIF